MLVCGGRDYADREFVFAVLDAQHSVVPIELLIHGDARGADTLGKLWAISRGVPHRAFPADWGLYGHGAGAVRNLQMLRAGKPDKIIAFPGGKGTANMVSQAKKAGVQILEIGEPE